MKESYLNFCYYVIMNLSNRKGLRTWIEIDKKALKNNYNIFRKLISKSTLLMSVVKSNAYGHGLVDFSKEAQKLGVDWFGVDSIVEAVTLRNFGIKKPILVLGYTLRSRLGDAIKNNISITIADLSSLRELKKIHGLKNKPKIHIKIDTGMHRQGFLFSEIPSVIKILKSIRGVELEGVYTHFSSAKDPSQMKETIRQSEEFKKVAGLFEEKGFGGFIKHISASGGSIILKGNHFDMVRIGIGLYGLWPSLEIKNAFKNKIGLEPVLSWRTIVSQIKKLPKGSGIGYDLTEKLKKDSIVAILPIGYWHGFPCSLSSVGNVLVRGKKTKVLGRVSMDMVCVDVTGINAVKVGDEVVLIGKSGGSEISVNDTAYLDETTGYEIVTRLNPLIRRILV
ncbi:MAG TPA: alanine racemase [Candidatus Paceibacterota bacterium]